LTGKKKKGLLTNEDVHIIIAENLDSVIKANFHRNKPVSNVYDIIPFIATVHMHIYRFR